MVKTGITKQALIDKASQMIVIVAAVAAFISVFCIVASKTLLSQAEYQNRVISQKKIALSTLKQDVSNVSTLDSAFQAWISTPTNIIGGNPSGTGSKDGDNGKITLDALPSTYDYPSLVTTFNQLAASLPVTGAIVNANSSAAPTTTSSTSQASIKSSPVPIPITFTFTGAYSNVQSAIQIIQSSIRPIQIQTIGIVAAAGGNLTVTITAQTFYQPSVSFSLGEETVK